MMLTLRRALVLRLGIRTIVACILCLDSTPELLIDLVLVEIAARIAGATAKEVDRAAVSQEHVRVSR